MFYHQTFLNAVSSVQNILASLVSSSSSNARVRGSDLEVPLSSRQHPAGGTHPLWATLPSSGCLSCPRLDTGAAGSHFFVSPGPCQRLEDPSPCFLPPYLNSRSPSPQMTGPGLGQVSGGRPGRPKAAEVPVVEADGE